MSEYVFHKIRSVGVIGKTTICAQFDSGVVKEYDISVLSSRIPVFSRLMEDGGLFAKVKADAGGYGIVWNEDIDLSSEEIWNNGKTVFSDFNGMLSFGDAAGIWKIEESTLRKAVANGKLTPGVDCCKYGKQWVVTRKAMEREYGYHKLYKANESQFDCAAEPTVDYVTDSNK